MVAARPEVVLRSACAEAAETWRGLYVPVFRMVSVGGDADSAQGVYGLAFAWDLGGGADLIRGLASSVGPEDAGPLLRPVIEECRPEAEFWAAALARAIDGPPPGPLRGRGEAEYERRTSEEMALYGLECLSEAGREARFLRSAAALSRICARLSDDPGSLLANDGHREAVAAALSWSVPPGAGPSEARRLAALRAPEVEEARRFAGGPAA